MQAETAQQINREIAIAVEAVLTRHGMKLEATPRYRYARERAYVEVTLSAVGAEVESFHDKSGIPVGTTFRHGNQTLTVVADVYKGRRGRSMQILAETSKGKRYRFDVDSLRTILSLQSQLAPEPQPQARDNTNRLVAPGIVVGDEFTDRGVPVTVHSRKETRRSRNTPNGFWVICTKGGTPYKYTEEFVRNALNQESQKRLAAGAQ